MWFKTDMDPNQTRPDNNKPLLMILEGDRQVPDMLGGMQMTKLKRLQMTVDRETKKELFYELYRRDRKLGEQLHQQGFDNIEFAIMVDREIINENKFLGYTFDKSSKFSTHYEILLEQATLYENQPYIMTSFSCEVSYKGASSQQFHNGYETYAQTVGFGDSYSFGKQKPSVENVATPILYDFAKVSWDVLNNPLNPQVNHMEAVCGGFRAIFTSYANCHKVAGLALNIVKVEDVQGKFHHETKYVQSQLNLMAPRDLTRDIIYLTQFENSFEHMVQASELSAYTVEFKSFTHEQHEAAEKLWQFIDDDNINFRSRLWGILKHSAAYLYSTWRVYHPLNLFGAKKYVSDIYVCNYGYSFEPQDIQFAQKKVEETTFFTLSQGLAHVFTIGFNRFQSFQSTKIGRCRQDVQSDSSMTMGITVIHMLDKNQRKKQKQYSLNFQLQIIPNVGFGQEITFDKAGNESEIRSGVLVMGVDENNEPCLQGFIDVGQLVEQSVPVKQLISEEMREIRFQGLEENEDPESGFKVPNLDEVLNMKTGEIYNWRKTWVTDCTFRLFPTVCFYFAIIDAGKKSFI